MRPEVSSQFLKMYIYTITAVSWDSVVVQSMKSEQHVLCTKDVPREVLLPFYSSAWRMGKHNNVQICILCLYVCS